MINISRSNKALLITSDNNQFPWKDGKMSVPLNSIAYIIDESDYVTFRSVANNDILFTSLIGELKINDESVSKDDLITMFDSVANSSGSGGGTASAGVNSINGYQGDVRIKTVNGTSLIGSGDITIEADLDNYYTKEEVDGKIPDVSDFITSIPSEYITEDELNDKGYLTSIPSEYITETELNDKGYLTSIPDDYALKTDIPTNVSELNNDANYITLNEVPKTDLSNYYTKEEVDGKIPDVSDFITSIPSEYITETELNDKGYLTSIPDTYITEGELTTALSDKVSQTALNEAIEGIDVGVKTINNTKGDVNIKTINGESLIGSGDITIEGESTDLSDYYTKQETNSLIPSTYVSRIEDFNLYTKDAPYKKIQLQYVNSDSETIITKEIILEWSGTQSEYDALGTYDDNITYNIIEG